MRSFELGGKMLLTLDIRGGPSGPFGVQFDNNPVEFYVRRNASTYPATQQEIRELAFTAPGSEDPFGFHVRGRG